MLVLASGGEVIAVRPDEVSGDVWNGTAVAHLRYALAGYAAARSRRGGVRDQAWEISGRFSYAVDSTVVVCVEHLASARIRASSDSRADMVGTWTFSR